MFHLRPSQVSHCRYPQVVALAGAVVLISCGKQESFPVSSTQQPTLDVSADDLDFDSTPARVILEDAKSDLGESTDLSLIRFSSHGESAEIRMRFRGRPGGDIGCSGIIGIQRETLDWGGEILPVSEVAERLSTLSEVARLTESLPVWLIRVDEDAPTSRLFELAKLVRELDPPIEFRLLSEN
jgi:hypothetical protein